MEREDGDPMVMFVVRLSWGQLPPRQCARSKPRSAMCESQHGRSTSDKENPNSDSPQYRTSRYYAASSPWGANFRRHVSDPETAWRGGVFEYHSWRGSKQAREFEHARRTNEHRRRGPNPSSRSEVASFDKFFEVLGVAPTASEQEVRAAYRRQAFRFHPDRVRDAQAKATAQARFQRIREAYDALCGLHTHQSELAKQRANAEQGSAESRKSKTRSSSPPFSTRRPHLTQDNREPFTLG